MADEPKKPSPTKILGSVVIAILVIGYTFGAVTQRIQKIDSTNLAIIVLGVLVLAVLLKPGILDRLQVFEVPGVKLHMLEKRQLQQQSKLDEFSLVLPVLLPETERKHLMNLAHKTTANYHGDHQVRSELRRLRSIGLIRSKPDQKISTLRDGATLDLSDLVALTPLGEQWVQRIESIEKPDFAEA